MQSEKWLIQFQKFVIWSTWMKWTDQDNEIVYHYNDVTMSAMASQITSPVIVYSTVHPGADQRKHQSSASLTFVRRIHWWPVNSAHKGQITRKMFPFDDVIMFYEYHCLLMYQTAWICRNTFTEVYKPLSKRLASLWLAGQPVLIPLLKWRYFEEYHTEYFKLSYDKCQMHDNDKAVITLAEEIDFRS